MIFWYRSRMAKRPRPRARNRQQRYAPPKQASESIFDVLQKMGLTDQVRRLRIAQAWNEAVGPEIAARTQPVTFNRGVLVVRSASAAWQNELTFLKAEIIERLNAALDSLTVRDLKVVGGTLQRPNPNADRPVWLDQKPTDNDLAVANDAEQPIADPEIRQAFRQLLLVDRRARRARSDD